MNMPSDASSDQSNCPNGYYRNTSGMVMQIPAQAQTAITAPKVDISDSDALRTLAKSKLVAIIENAPISTALVPAIKELLDRIDGKAAQSITQNVNVRGAIAVVSQEEVSSIIDGWLSSSPSVMIGN